MHVWNEEQGCSLQIICENLSGSAIPHMHVHFKCCPMEKENLQQFKDYCKGDLHKTNFTFGAFYYTGIRWHPIKSLEDTWSYDVTSQKAKHLGGHLTGLQSFVPIHDDAMRNDDAVQVSVVVRWVAEEVQAVTWPVVVNLRGNAAESIRSSVCIFASLLYF